MGLVPGGVKFCFAALGKVKIGRRVPIAMQLLKLGIEVTTVHSR
jgi:hypothetical protein